MQAYIERSQDISLVERLRLMAQTVVRNLKLYQTKANYYLVGRTKDKKSFRLCKFSRQEVYKSLVENAYFLPAFGVSILHRS